MQFDKDATFQLLDDDENAADPLGRTASYNPEDFSINLYVTGRHPKDILRSAAHELVHHNQNCRGKIDNDAETGEGYAQKDEGMRALEKEAYEQGNILFRDWEDGKKGE